VGGIFFDDLASGDACEGLRLRARGRGGLPRGVSQTLVQRRCRMPYDEQARDKLLVKRGRYVEFNLVYDRGTKFGFATDADPEAYLMSLPPLRQVVRRKSADGLSSFRAHEPIAFCPASAQSPCVRPRQRSTAVHLAARLV
jgi:coproporphyrinogen III oxidase